MHLPHHPPISMPRCLHKKHEYICPYQDFHVNVYSNFTCNNSQISINKNLSHKKPERILEGNAQKMSQLDNKLKNEPILCIFFSV